MKFVGIVAVGENLEIGKNGSLPWHHPEDLSFFKRTTSGHTVVMGFNTWVSIGRPLPNRKNVVISRTRVPNNDGVVCLRSVEDVVNMFNDTEQIVFVIGGSHTYESFGSLIEEWLVTRIPETISDADAHMNPGFLDGFVKVEEESLSKILKVERYVRK